MKVKPTIRWAAAFGIPSPDEDRHPIISNGYGGVAMEIEFDGLRYVVELKVSNESFVKDKATHEMGKAKNWHNARWGHDFIGKIIGVNKLLNVFKHGEDGGTDNSFYNWLNDFTSNYSNTCVVPLDYAEWESWVADDAMSVLQKKCPSYLFTASDDELECGFELIPGFKYFAVRGWNKVFVKLDDGNVVEKPL